MSAVVEVPDAPEVTAPNAQAGRTSKTVEIDSHAMNFGPQHPAAHGVLRLVVEMDGEVVERESGGTSGHTATPIRAARLRSANAPSRCPWKSSRVRRERSASVTTCTPRPSCWNRGVTS